MRRTVAQTPQLLIVQDIARDGRVLAHSDDWPMTMMCLPPGAPREVDLTWLDFSAGRALSDDGRDLVFTESGAGAGAKGATNIHKTDGSAPAGHEPGASRKPFEDLRAGAGRIPH